MTRQFFPSSSSSFFFLVYPSYPVANRFRPPTPAADCRSTFETNPASKLTPLYAPQIGSENPGNHMNEFLEYLASYFLAGPPASDVPGLRGHLREVGPLRDVGPSTLSRSSALPSCLGLLAGCHASQQPHSRRHLRGRRHQRHVRRRRAPGRCTHIPPALRSLPTLRAATGAPVPTWAPTEWQPRSRSSSWPRSRACSGTQR